MASTASTSSSEMASAATPTVSSMTTAASGASTPAAPDAVPLPPEASSFPLKRTVVTAKRKEELLLHARAERKRWVRTVPLPYDSKQLASIVGNNRAEGMGAAANGTSKAINEFWSSYDGLDRFQNSLICSSQFLPVATAVLSELYGIGGTLESDEDDDVEVDNGNNNDALKEHREHPLSLNETAKRVEQLANSYWVNEEKESHGSDQKVETKSEKNIPDATAQKNGARANTGANDDDDKDDKYEDLRTAYSEFLNTMLLPESAVTVQGMKNFLRQFVASPQSTKQYSDHELQVRNMASMLNGHARSSYESLITEKNSNSNTSNTGEGVPDWSRRSLESFLYGQTKETVDSILDRVLGNSAIEPSSSSPFSMTQRLFDVRLEELQFLQPSHLDIACLNDDVDNKDRLSGSTAPTGKSELESLLEEPIKSLQSIEAFYSPYEKLSRVLEVFRGVNVALSKTSEALPSADDVLPTVILVVVKAAAITANKKIKAPPLRNLLRDLYFIESFALPEYLRGEAGYAFTNLYGAVQFLQELELDRANDGMTNAGPSNSLSISAEELRVKLEKSRADATKYNKKRQAMLGTSNDDERKLKGLISQGVEELLGGNNDGTEEAETFVPASPRLSVMEVRAARLRGETLNLEWARRHQEGQPTYGDPMSRDGTKLASSPTKSPSRSKAPQQRYSFLGLRPENVKLSDLPKLLDEYKRLALTTEELLGEQQRLNSKIQSERKRQRDEKYRLSLGERALLL